MSPRRVYNAGGRHARIQIPLPTGDLPITMVRLTTLLALACVLGPVVAQNSTGPGGQNATDTQSGQNATASPDQNSTESSNETLRVGPIDFAGYTNYAFRDNVTACQVVISNNASSAPSRFITAFPDGNTGAMVYFIPSNGSTLLTTLDADSFKSIRAEDGQRGVEGNLTMSADVSFGVTLIGSVRTLRDYTESGGVVFHSIFNYTLGNYSTSSVTLVRNWINGSTVQYLSFEAASNAVFNVTPSTNVTLPPNITITRPDSASNATIHFLSTFNFTNDSTTLVGLGKQDLFLSEAPSNSSDGLSAVLEAIRSNGSSIADQASFLAYQDRFFAGGWRFLTYFGRDTLLTLRLLLPTMTSQSIEALLGAVIERTNSTGTLCHEETVGDYASFINIQNNQSELGNTPSYSYVMLDTDFLLLPVLADYLLTTPQGQNRSTEFLGKTSTLKNGTFNELLTLNVEHVIALARPFAERQSWQTLAEIRDPTVGNWRDSNTGLGYGTRPFDVNVALIPAALRAIDQLATAGIISSNSTANASSYAEIWEASAAQYFQVSISAEQAQARLEGYVPNANLSIQTLYGAGALNATANSTDGWGTANQTIGIGEANSTFYGLSLSAQGTPVEVLHSDLGFVLEYGLNVSESIIKATVQALQPYPRGLLTNVGMVVANAAYDTNRTNTGVFSNIRYHGAVSWSWQTGLMASGITKQLGLCGQGSNSTLTASVNGTVPTWCNNTQLVDELKQAQTRLWDSIEGSSSVLYTEVWSPIYSKTNNTFSIGDLGAISEEGTEGDAIQLWSYGFLAQVDPRTGRPVANGF